MSILSDFEIKERVLKEKMISPFAENLISYENDKKILSYGLSSYGYDARAGDSFKIFTNVNSAIIDPKNISSESFVEKKGDFCIIPPNGFCLAHTVEDFFIPRDILVICVGKSTYISRLKDGIFNHNYYKTNEPKTTSIKFHTKIDFNISFPINIIVTEFPFDGSPIQKQDG